jgi:glycosyltransferase involved in cell wall biosynthesis
MTATLSVIIPVYNEADTIHLVIEAVRARPEVGEIVIVDDASTDGTWARLQELAVGQEGLRLLRHDLNQGKGAALRTGFTHATKDFVLIQDADLEYDPEDYARILGPLVSGKADVVFGSRFFGFGAHRVLYFWHSIGNNVLTLLSNMCTDLNLSDMECGYKAFRREVIQSIVIEENRFGFEPEITAKVARKKLRIYEVPVSYYGRTYAEGKKIGWKDGFSALRCILWYGLLGR